MFPLAVPLIAAAAEIGGNLIQGSEQKSAAQEQMDFQERMSNTAWQRGVKDMRAAGINPMLSFAQGPASSPSGAMAATTNPVGGAVSSALQAAQVQPTIDNVKADTDVKRQDAAQKFGLNSGGYWTAIRDKAAADVKVTEQQANALVLGNKMLEMSMAGAKNLQDVEKGWAGKVGAFLAALFGGGRLAAGASSAGALVRGAAAVAP